MGKALVFADWLPTKRLSFAKTSAPREINNIATAISPPLDQRCHIVTLVFRERLQERTEFSIATDVWRSISCKVEVEGPRHALVRDGGCSGGGQ